jgi:hypothetical protein
MDLAKAYAEYLILGPVVALLVAGLIYLYRHTEKIIKEKDQDLLKFANMVLVVTESTKWTLQKVVEELKDKDVDFKELAKSMTSIELKLDQLAERIRDEFASHKTKN